MFLLQNRRKFIFLFPGGYSCNTRSFFYTLKERFFRALASPGGLVNVCLSFTVTKVVLFSVYANIWYYFLYSFNRYLLFNLKTKGLFTFTALSGAFLHGEERHQRTPADTSGHQRTPADTSSHQRTPADTSSHQQPPAATSSHQQPPADTSSHQQPPADTSSHQRTPAATRHAGRGHRPGIYHLRTGSQRDTSHVARRGVFIANRAKIFCFKFKLSDCYSVLKGLQKKGNRIPSDCLYILYILSFLHAFPFSIFAKNKKSMKKRKLICTIVGIILGAPLGLVIGYILRKYILLLLQ